MSRGSGILAAGRWGLIALPFGIALACSSSPGSPSTNAPDGSAAATGGSTGGAGNGGAGNGGAGGARASGGAVGSGGIETCLVCGAGGAFGTGGRFGTGGTASGGTASGGTASGGTASGGAGGAETGGVPAFCTTPGTDLIPPMKTCQRDADCTVVPTFSCCGPGTIYGIATTSVPRFSQCFMTKPPQGCPPVGCSSQARTEDNQGYHPVNYTDLSGVEARCVDIGGGTKECTSALRGSCMHNITRCEAADVCANPCGASCTCQNGYIDCPRPTGTCASTSAVCEYPATPGSQTFTSCTCPSPGAPWACSP